MKNEQKKVVKKVYKKKYLSNLGKKGFVMDRKTYLNWFDY